MSKITKDTLIKNRKGLHARASAKVVKLAEAFKANLYICHQGTRVSATSIMDLLMLGASQGTPITIEGMGTDADEAVSALIALIDNEFGEK